MATVTAWTAVAGVGTYEGFPDTLPRSSTGGGSGVASIRLAGADGPATVPLDFAGLVPGGTLTRPITLVNDGTADLSSVSLTTVAFTAVQRAGTPR